MPGMMGMAVLHLGVGVLFVLILHVFAVLPLFELVPVLRRGVAHVREGQAGLLAVAAPGGFTGGLHRGIMMGTGGKCQGRDEEDEFGDVFHTGRNRRGLASGRMNLQTSPVFMLSGSPGRSEDFAEPGVAQSGKINVGEDGRAARRRERLKSKEATLPHCNAGLVVYRANTAASSSLMAIEARAKPPQPPAGIRTIQNGFHSPARPDGFPASRGTGRRLVGATFARRTAAQASR